MQQCNGTCTQIKLLIHPIVHSTNTPNNDNYKTYESNDYDVDGHPSCAVEFREQSSTIDQIYQISTTTVSFSCGTEPSPSFLRAAT